MPQKIKNDFPYQEMLVRFFELKAKKLWKGYLLPEDLTAVRAWSDNQAKRVWKQLRTLIMKDDCEGINEYTCPFCIKYLNTVGECDKCEYARNRKSCCLDFDDPEWDLQEAIEEKNKEEIKRIKGSFSYQILMFFQKKEKQGKDEYTWTPIPSKYLKKCIEQIEKEFEVQ
jgi:hypothetical protein